MVFAMKRALELICDARGPVIHHSCRPFCDPIARFNSNTLSHTCTGLEIILVLKNETSKENFDAELQILDLTKKDNFEEYRMPWKC